MMSPQDEEKPSASQPNGIDNATNEENGYGAVNNTPPLESSNIRKKQKRLSVETMNWGVPTNHQAKMHTKETVGHESWEYRALHFLHKHSVQAFFSFLLLVDVLLLFTELILLSIYPSCDLVERDAVSCCPAPHNYGKNDLIRILGTDDEHHGDSHLECDAGLEPYEEYEATCDDHKWSTVHNAEHGIFILTMIILSLFFLQLCIEIIALKPKVFFRQFFYALDFFIITMSIVLEAVFHALKSDISQSAGGLLIIVRLWRFLRIGHGISDLTAEVMQEQFQELLSYTEELEQLLKANQIELPKVDDAIKNPLVIHDDENLIEVIEAEEREKHRLKHHSEEH